MSLSQGVSQGPDGLKTIPWAPNDALERAHLVGICGAGMKALAELLTDAGCSVSGSDLAYPENVVRSLRNRGVQVHRGHDAAVVPRDADVLVFSPAIGPENAERQLAARQEIPQLSYSRMLGTLMEGRLGVAVAGTHGKSTTTAMLGTILETAGLRPSVVVGAELRDHRRSGWAGEGRILVVESCEYQQSFLDVAPTVAGILSIEPDHFDCYSDLDAMQAAFTAFAGKVRPGGVLVVSNECAASRAAASGFDGDVQTFGVTSGTDWRASDYSPTDEGARFRVLYQDRLFAEIELPVPGRHNALNALAAAALSHNAGAGPQDVTEGLRAYGGLGRRFEILGTWNGVTLVDDYAHHPTAVQATLQTTRQRFPGRRIVCAFQPHQVSRTEALFEDFCGCFETADEVLIVPIFAARETQDTRARRLSRALAEGIAEHGTRARYCDCLDQLETTLEDEARSGDVVITMGAGDIDRVQHAFNRRLQ